MKAALENVAVWRRGLPASRQVDRLLGEHGLREATPGARAELEKRAKSDPEKLALAARLRRETPLPLKGIT